MSIQEPIDTKEFLTTFQRFMNTANQYAHAQEPEPVFLNHLRAHFTTNPIPLPVVTEQFEQSEHPNLHLALHHLLAQDGWSMRLLGVIAIYDHSGVKFSHLLGTQHGAQVTEGPVEYVNIPLNDDQVLACVQSGLYLIRRDDQSLALLVRGPREAFGRSGLSIEVMATERTAAEAFLAELRHMMRARNVYRSRVISLDYGHHGLSVQFHRLPQIAREDIILPSGVLARIERQTLGFSRLVDKLRAAHRHIKRGILLYGPPGTGKTLTAMHIASQMPERTIILLTGRGIGLLEESCNMARLLQPATVIMEDVDLIAEERTHQNTGCNALLFELLNQMDGLAEDADILFLLTTNRPDILEPALAARPGRIDQAVEVPLPDRDCRQRLFDLYGQGMALHLQRLPQLIDQTEGVSATFIRELMRKAALFAAEEQQDILVEDRHIEESLKELLFEGGELTKRLLGAGKSL